MLEYMPSNKILNFTVFVSPVVKYILDDLKATCYWEYEEKYGWRDYESQNCHDWLQQSWYLLMQSEGIEHLAYEFEFVMETRVQLMATRPAPSVFTNRACHLGTPVNFLERAGTLGASMDI